MNAISLLQRQHRKVEATLEALEKVKEPSSRVSSLLQELAGDLASHMVIEQNIFYPAIRGIEPELVEESFEEHSMAEIALKRLLRTPAGDEQFHSRLSVLRELIHQHVEEEEEALFPHVKETMSEKDLETLGKKLEQAFDAAQHEGFEALVPQGFAHTSADEALKLIATEAGESTTRPRRGARARASG